MRHNPVLLAETIHLLDPQPGETVIDCTVGLGGHAAEMLKTIGKTGKFIGLDADEENLVEMENVALRHLRQERMENVQLIHENFGRIAELDLPQCDVLFADLGLSSPHIDDPRKGFSFQHDGPLDMRFDRTKGQTAAQMIESASENDLADILFHYGELKRSRLLARAIKSAPPPHTTGELVKIVEEVSGRHTKKELPQIFQALRIAVNDEMGALDHLLDHGPALLQPGGRMGVISYHSLEDRKVKQRFKELSITPKDAFTGADIAPASYLLLTKKAVQATLEEQKRNPRSRSARLRVLRRVP